MPKKHRYPVMIFLALLIWSWGAAALSAQTINWEIKKHSKQEYSLKREVKSFMEKGFLPLGLTYNGEDLYILYVKGTGQQASGWLIEMYDGRDELKDGLTEAMKKGYLPTGVTYMGSKIYILYIQSNNSATGWWLEPSETDLSKVKADIQPYVSQGYVPMDITAYEGTYLTLLVKLERTMINSWTIQRYNVGKHGDAINANIREGNIPWGIMYRGNVIDILYVGIKQNLFN